MTNRERNFILQAVEFTKEKRIAPGGIRTHGLRIRNPVVLMPLPLF
jgi:hypothetical protein